MSTSGDNNQDTQENDELTTMSNLIKKEYFKEMVNFFNNTILTDVKQSYTKIKPSFEKFLNGLNIDDKTTEFNKVNSNGFQKFIDTKSSLNTGFLTQNYKIKIFTD